MIDNLFTWHPENYTNEENSRWVWLRATEWEAYPNFLSPLWGIFIVYFYGWGVFLLALIISTFVWRVFIMKSFISIGLLATISVIINFLKWPLAILFTVIS